MRTRFEMLLQQGLSNTEIEECLSRSRITVTREKKCCALLPRARRKPQRRCEQAKRSVLGGWRRVCERPL